MGLYQVRILPYIGAEVSDLQMPKMWSNGADGKRGRVMRECKEYEITIEKLLNVVHSYTDPIRIYVIIGDAWLTCEEARGTRRLHDFYLTKAHTEYDDEEKERLIKYYKDVPVWNITAWHDVDCREIRYGIEARCHYKDVREGYLAEKADLKRAKERERRKKKREQKERSE